MNQKSSLLENVGAIALILAIIWLAMQFTPRTTEVTSSPAVIITPTLPVAQAQAEAEATAVVNHESGSTNASANAAAAAETMGSVETGQINVNEIYGEQICLGGNCSYAKAEAEVVVDQAPPPPTPEPTAVPMATGAVSGQMFTCGLFLCRPAKNAQVSLVLDDHSLLACVGDPLAWEDEGYITCHGIPHDSGFRLVVSHDGEMFYSERHTLSVSGTSVYPLRLGEVKLEDGRIIPRR